MGGTIRGGEIMKRITLTRSMTAAMTVAMVVGLTACGGAKEEIQETTQNIQPEQVAADAAVEEKDVTTENVSGTITMAGSTSMEKLANAVAESFMAKYPNVIVTAEFTGSSAGIESVLAGSVNIGNASRALKDSEKESGAVENIVAIDGIAVVTDSANAVADLTKEQLISIYTGQTTNWSELDWIDSFYIYYACKYDVCKDIKW